MESLLWLRISPRNGYSVSSIHRLTFGPNRLSLSTRDTTQNENPVSWNLTWTFFYQSPIRWVSQPWLVKTPEPPSSVRTFFPVTRTRIFLLLCRIGPDDTTLVRDPFRSGPWNPSLKKPSPISFIIKDTPRLLHTPKPPPPQTRRISSPFSLIYLQIILENYIQNRLNSFQMTL